MAWRESGKQMAMMETQTAVLAQLQKSASVTAETLVLLQATTADMNAAVQTQLHLASRVALDVLFDGLSILTLTNKGRTAVLLRGHKFDGLPATMDAFARSLPPSGFLQFQAPEALQWFTKIPPEKSTFANTTPGLR